MEGAGLHALGAHRPQPVAHLPRRAGGERHREDLLRLDETVADQVIDAVGDGAGLAGAGAGEDAHRAERRGGRLQLFGVEHHPWFGEGATPAGVT